MSMREYAVNDYGLIINEQIRKIIASKVCEDYSDKEYEEDAYLFDYNLYEKGIVEYISDFTGEAIRINIDGTEGHFNTSYYNEIIYYIPAQKVGNLFKAAYKNIDEMINEFKEKIGEYVPDDFCYGAYICHIVGTYWG